MAIEGLEQLYATSYRRLVVQMFAVTGDMQEAEDVVQETFVRAIDHWSKIREYDAPEAWLHTVALNLARSRWRRGKRAVALMARLGPPRHAPEPSPDHVALVTALRALPEAQREAIVLHHVGDYSVDEVASATSAPSGTVKARLSRGRAALADLLEPAAEETELVDG